MCEDPIIAEVRRIRAETERMRRLLIDLERRSGDL